MLNQPPRGLPLGWKDAGSPLALIRRGLELHQRDALAEAQVHYEQALQIDARHPDALNLLGVLKLSCGDANGAVGLLERAAASAPRSSVIQSNLGNALRAAGRPADAIVRYAVAVRLDPQHAAAHYNLGQALRSLARFDEAAVSLRRAQQLAPQDMWAQALAETLMQRGDLSGAEDALNAQLRRSPDWATGFTLQGGLRVLQGRVEEGLILLDHAIALEPRQAGHLAAKGAWLLRARRIEEAEHILRAAIAIDAHNASIWNDLGRALRAQGDLDEARTAFSKALSFDAAHADARRNLALIQDSHSSSSLGELERLLEGGKLSTTDRALAEFAAGKLLDDIGETTEAFKRYENGNRHYLELRRDTLKDAEKWAVERAAIALEAATRPLDTKGLDDPTPVFVVGMPRSGTSLIEQVVATHSQGFGAGELSWMSDYAQGLWKDEDVGSAAALYLRQTKALAPSAARIVDKLPSNLLYLDKISCLLDRPRVVICRRHPLDTILSCYFQVFSNGNDFSYDLQACARRWITTDRLAEAYLGSVRIRSYEIWYEAFVRDIGNEAPNLFRFLELPWEAACLNFHETRRVVATASGWQVRQPVYLKAIGRWRSYAPQLQTALGSKLFDELLQRADAAPPSARH